MGYDVYADRLFVHANEVGPWLDDVTAGTAAASKALILDANKAISTIATLTATNVTIAALTATALKLAVSSVAAAGSTIGQGGDLAAGINIVSAADNTKCVDLPTAVAGTVVVVVSATVGKTLPVFPATNAAIDNVAANAALTLGAATAYTGGIFFAKNATQWYSLVKDEAAA